MKKPSKTEIILNSFGWKTVNGKVEYRGFEHLLNKDLPDWRLTEEDADETNRFDVPVEVSPAIAAAQKVQQEMHSKLVAAQQRVDKLKAKAKDIKK